MENFLSPVINKALILTTILLFSQSGWSQHSPFCGTPDLEEIKDQMILNRQEFPLVKTRNATTYLPLKAHIVGDSEGNGKINEGDLLEMLCLLNENFADLDIQFYFKDGFNYINNSFIYNNTNPGNSIFRSEVRSIKNKHKAVNVFFKGKVGEEGVLAYYMPSPGVNDFIVVSNSSARNPRVVTHEIGHYFTLLHPFHGWDDDPWDPSVHGNPVGTLAPDNRTINEFADGSNCDPDKNASENNVGDGICDTPADYNFASSSCNYTGDALDPNSEPVSPQVNNWMNYFSGCSNYEFTDGQIKEINRSLNSSSRTDLFSNYSPNIEVINDMPALIYPIQSEEIGQSTSVELQWTAVDNADWYLVEIDRIPTIDFDVRSFVTNDTKIIIDHLDIDRNYFWKVTPFNEYYTCAGSSDVERFKTSISTSVKEIPSISSFAIFPTIALPSQSIYLELSSDDPFNAVVQLFDFSGKPVTTAQPWRVSQGFNKKQIQLNHLTPGIYITRVSTEKGTLSRKIIIQ